MWALALGTSEKIHGTDRKRYVTGAHRRGSVYGVLLDLDKREVSAPPSHKTFTLVIRIHSRNQRSTRTPIAPMQLWFYQDGASQGLAFTLPAGQTYFPVGVRVNARWGRER